MKNIRGGGRAMYGHGGMYKNVQEMERRCAGKTAMSNSKSSKGKTGVLAISIQIAK
tara:strand:+ start:1040 stop:1207 length:168 start_codon:yes stop_codon:yes gene_type:complete